MFPLRCQIIHFNYIYNFLHFHIEKSGKVNKTTITMWKSNTSSPKADNQIKAKHNIAPFASNHMTSTAPMIELV